MSARAIACLGMLAIMSGVVAAPANAQHGAPGGEWPTYGGDLGHTRYAALDQIDAENFSDLELAWRFRTANLGPGPEYVFQSTPLMVDGVLYTTAGTRRAAVALDAATGELLWVHRLNEGRAGRRSAEAAVRARPDVLGRRGRRGDFLRHPRLPPHRAERPYGPPRAGLRRERPGRPEAGPRPGARPPSPARSGCTRPRSSPTASSSSAPPTSPASRPPRRRSRPGTSAATTPGPASGSGSSTPFPAPTSSATTRGWPTRGATPATPGCGAR